MNDVYPLLPKWKWAYAGTTTLFYTLVFMAVFYARIESTSLVCSLILGMVLLPVIAIQLSAFELIVLPEGLRFRNGGRVVFAKWNELTEIQEIRYLLFLKVSRVFVLQPTKNQTAIHPLASWSHGIDPVVDTRHSAFIPLSLFADRWRESELGDRIRQCAPHLFQ